jgi:branched-subunit amino acid aminotransferase/4-amino-4-deoxychorismate lyase
MTPHQYVISNLDLVKKEELSFPFWDCGFLYGYGLFETILIHNYKPILIESHLQRLQYGADVFEIPYPFEKKKTLQKIDELIQKNDVKTGTLNLYLTPGDRPEGTWQFEDPFFLIVTRPFMPKKNEGLTMEVREESFQRTRLDRFKSLSWIKNVLENKLSTVADSVLLFNHEKKILEAPSANVFFVRGKTLITPKSPLILPGITRNFIIENATKMGLIAEEREVKCEELAEFQEIFLTNSLHGVINVKKVIDYPALVSAEVSDIVKTSYQTMLQISK